MAKDMFDQAIGLGDAIAYIGSSEYATRRIGIVTKVDGSYLRIGEKDRLKAGWNCVLIKKATTKHSECPHCGSTDTFWGDSSADPDDDMAVFHMECGGCGGSYNSYFVPDSKSWDED